MTQRKGVFWHMACVELEILESIAQATDSRVLRKLLLVDFGACVEFDYYVDEMARRNWIAISSELPLSYSLTADGQRIVSGLITSDNSLGAP